MPGPDGAGMLRRLALGFFSLAAWLFGPRAAWLDLKLAVLAGGFFALMIAKPALFDRGGLAGVSWLPDPAWITLMAVLTVLHGLGLARPWQHKVRIAASLGSAWVWTLVALSIWRVELSTGVLNYGLVGLGALFGAIYVAGLPRESR